MKIAFASDIHANLPALLSALEVARQADAERFIVAGDLVGDGPHPREVIAELRQRSVLAIRGNVDRKVLELGTDRGALEELVAQGKGQPSNRAWTALQLLDAVEERHWLAELPAQRIWDIAGQRVLLVHGSPLGDTDYLYPSLTPLGLRNKLQGWQGDPPSLLASGHSHVPFARQIDGVLVVNCGSVGRPADGDPRGSLVLVDVERHEQTGAEVVRFHYPVDAVIHDLGERGVPGIDPEEYRRGVKR